MDSKGGRCGLAAPYAPRQFAFALNGPSPQEPALGRAAQRRDPGGEGTTST